MCYLAGGTFLHRADDGLPGQGDEDVGAVVVQSHVVAIEGDDAQVGHDGAAACQTHGDNWTVLGAMIVRSFTSVVDTVLIKMEFALLSLSTRHLCM